MASGRDAHRVVVDERRLADHHLVPAAAETTHQPAHQQCASLKKEEEEWASEQQRRAAAVESYAAPSCRGGPVVALGVGVFKPRRARVTVETADAPSWSGRGRRRRRRWRTDMSTPSVHQSTPLPWPLLSSTSGAMYSGVPQSVYLGPTRDEAGHTSVGRATGHRLASALHPPAAQ
jgi:hypothetical protein